MLLSRRAQIPSHARRRSISATIAMTSIDCRDKISADRLRAHRYFAEGIAARARSPGRHHDFSSGDGASAKQMRHSPRRAGVYRRVTRHPAAGIAPVASHAARRRASFSRAAGRTGRCARTPWRCRRLSLARHSRAVGAGRPHTRA